MINTVLYQQQESVMDSGTWTCKFFYQFSEPLSPEYICTVFSVHQTRLLGLSISDTHTHTLFVLLILCL